MSKNYLEECGPLENVTLERFYSPKSLTPSTPQPQKPSLFDRIREYAYPLVFGSLMFFNTLNVKSDSKSDFADFRIPVTSAYVASSVSSNLESVISRNEEGLKPFVEYISHLDDGKFKDNELYAKLRLKDAQDHIKKYDPKSTVLAVDKTFQKALLFTYDGSTYDFEGEYDCGTGRHPGNKRRVGDNKTPVGMFRIYSIEPAKDKLWDGKKAYGPYFLRIKGSIGVHGNGTDKVLNSNWMHDRAYMPPDTLGIHDDNFAVGPSHGCIRMYNDVIRNMVDERVLTTKTNVIIYEDKGMTDILKDVYD